MDGEKAMLFRETKITSGCTSFGKEAGEDQKEFIRTKVSSIDVRLSSLLEEKMLIKFAGEDKPQVVQPWQYLAAFQYFWHFIISGTFG